MTNTMILHILSQPSLFIGLGGTGVDILRILKSMLLERGEQIPRHIQFLGIDTADQRTAAEYELLSADEFLPAQVREAEKYLSLLYNHPIQRWWPKIPKNRKNIYGGASQVRAVGRLALHINLEKIKKALRKKIDKIAEINVNAQRRTNQLSAGDALNVYIVSSLCGGTGSGMFLDISLLCQHFLQEKTNCVKGVFVLPEIFANTMAPRRIYANTYAALVELDHLMTVSESRMEAVEFSKDFSLEVNNPPFDWIYLVDKQNEKSGLVNDIETLKRFIAEELQLMLLSEIAEAENGSLDNLKDQLDKERGKRRCYSGLGHCSIDKAQKESIASPYLLAIDLIDKFISPLSQDGEEIDQYLDKYENLTLFHKADIWSRATELLYRKQDEMLEFANSKKQQNSPMATEVLLGKKWKESFTPELEELTQQLLTPLRAYLQKDQEKLLQEVGGVVLLRDLSHKLLERILVEQAKLMQNGQTFTVPANGRSSENLNEINEAPDSLEESQPLFLRIRSGLKNLFSRRQTDTLVFGLSLEEKETAKAWLNLQLKNDISFQLRKALKEIESELQSKINKTRELGDLWRKTKKWLKSEYQYLAKEQDYNAEVSSFRLEIPAVNVIKADFNAFFEQYNYGLDWINDNKQILGAKLIQLADKLIKDNEKSSVKSSSDLEAALLNLKRNPKELDAFFLRANIAATPMIEYSLGSMALGERVLPRAAYIAYPERFEIDFKKAMGAQSLASIDNTAPELVSLKGFNQIIFTQKVFGLPAFAIASAHKEWMEKYWLESQSTKGHIWENPHLLEDLFSGVNDNKEAWELLGKAQAYGLLPWDCREQTIKVKEYPFDFNNLLYGSSMLKNVFQLYLHLVCNVRTERYEQLEDLIKAFEEGTHSSRLPDETLKRIQELRQKVEKYGSIDLDRMKREHIDALKTACKNDKITIPIQRFYHQIQEALQP